MATAMKTLGFSPYSFDIVFSRVNGGTHPTEWHAVLAGEKAINPYFFERYDCFVGPPAAVLHHKLLAILPGYTKVVLMREPEKEMWAADVQQFIIPLVDVAAKLGRKTRLAQHVHSTLINMYPFDLALPVSKLAQGLEDFEEQVIKTVPSNRLLVWTQSDGYESLCKFLSIDNVPSDSFPPFETGMDAVLAMTRRLEHAQTFSRVMLVLAVAILLIAAVPLYNSIRGVFSELYKEYTLAFKKAQEDGRDMRSIRNAMVVAKQVAMNFDRQSKEQSPIVALWRRNAEPRQPDE